MASAIDTVVDLIHPASGVQAVIVGDQVWVIFDQEIDESSVPENFFVTGPDNDTWSGPDLVLWQSPNGSQTEEDILNSPGYAGVVQGEHSFERISLSGLNTVTTEDVTGNGSLYRTKAIFTATKQFTPDTEWLVYLLGDEDEADTILTGIRPRSVFDTEQSGSGTGELDFTGSYSGAYPDDVINIEIVASGVKRTATFNWWLSSDPGDVHGPVLTDSKIILAEGIYAEFGEGSFATGDEYTAVVKRVEPFTGRFIWNFETGSGSITLPIPTTTSTSVIGNLVPTMVSSTVAATTFTLSSITPKDRATNLPLTTNQIVLQFDSEVDPATVTSEKISIIAYPVNGDPDLLEERIIYKDITVSGTKIIIDF